MKRQKEGERECKRLSKIDKRQIQTKEIESELNRERGSENETVWQREKERRDKEVR